jgi:hypothetical protein
MTSSSDELGDISSPVTAVLSSSDGLGDVSSPITAMTSSSDGRMMSQRLSLLETTVAIGNLTSDHQLLLDRHKFIKPEILSSQF